MNAVARALSLGYSANQVIQYLSATNPDMKEKIRQAKRTGHSEKSILDFLSSTPTNIDGPIQTPTEAYQDRLGSDTRNIATGIGAGAALAGSLGSYALGRALPSAIKGVSSILGGNEVQNQALPNQTRKIPVTPQNQQMPQQEDAVGIESKPQEQEIESLRPEKEEKPLLEIEEDPGLILDQLDKRKNVDLLLSSNMPPEDLSIAIQAMMSPSQKKWIKSNVKTPFNDLITKYAMSQGDPNPKPTQKQQSEQEPRQHIEKNQHSLATQQPLELETTHSATPQNHNQLENKPTEKKMEPKPIKKGDTVLTKTGRLGKILDVRDGIASYREGVETKHRKESEIQAEPEIIKSAKIVFDPKSIPENTKSSALGFVTTNKKRTTVDIMYGPSGEFTRFYKKDGSQISEDDIEKIRNGMTTPVTSGDTYMGLWDTSVSDSRGAHVASEFKANSQPLEEGVESDPDKKYWAETLESPYIHGYIKSFLDALSDSSKRYSKASTLRKKVNEFKKNRD